MVPSNPKSFLLAQVEAGARFATRESIDAWLQGQVTIVDILFKPNEEFLRTIKEQALAVLDTVSGQDLQGACLRGAPQWAAIWYSPLAAARFEGDTAIMRRFVRDL